MADHTRVAETPTIHRTDGATARVPFNTETVSVTTQDRPSFPDSRGGIPRAPYLWREIESLIKSRLTDIEGLTRHGLGPIAADVLQQLGRSVPLLLIHQQRSARAAALTAPVLLERVRNACEGPVLVLKGPELAARYPNRSRLYGDLDISLVTDAKEAQRALISAGFEELDDPEGLWVGIHHLPRLFWPGLPLQIEVHSRPKWLEGISPPRIDELFEAAVPTSSDVPGLLRLARRTTRSWLPLTPGRTSLWGDSVTSSMLEALAAEVDPWELEDQARRWGGVRMWATTVGSLEAILGGRRTAPLRLWAGHVAEIRDQTVFEQHIERVISPFWGLPFNGAARLSIRALANEFRPAFDETWAEKIHRTTRAISRARLAVSTHDRQLGGSAMRGRRRNRPPGAANDSGESKD